MRVNNYHVNPRKIRPIYNSKLKKDIDPESVEAQSVCEKYNL
jgi:hypothetical protein